MSAGISKFALAEFNRRRAKLTAAAREGVISHDNANHKALIWLAIAGASGADSAEMYVECIWPKGKRVKAHWFHIAAPDDCVAELDRARRIAARRAAERPKDLRLQQHAWDLEALADYHGCEPLYATQQQEAA